MSEKQAPYADRLKQARHDAVASIARCMLPLEPQNPPKHSALSLSGASERARLAWRDWNEPNSYQCATKEMRAKAKIYNVEPFSRMEEDELMQQGMLRAETLPKGSTRPRRYGRD